MGFQKSVDSRTNSAHDWFVHFPIMSDNQAAAESASKQAMKAAGFSIGVSEDRNKRYRRAMEDSHISVTNFSNVERQGFFGIYDGHAGKATAEWCGENLHQVNMGIIVLTQLFVTHDYIYSRSSLHA